MLVTLWGIFTSPPSPVYLVSTPSEEINKPGASGTGVKVAGAVVSVLSSHVIFLSHVKAIILSSLSIVTVTVIVTEAEAEAASNIILLLSLVLSITLPLVAFLPPDEG